MSKTHKTRKTRIPVSTRRVLSAEQRPGYVRRWVNDVSDRIAMFMDAGYTPVGGDADNSDKRAQDPSKMGSSVVRKSVGGDVEAVLMEIPEEYYNEDQLAKMQHVDEKEEAFDPTRRISRSTYGNTFKKTYSGPNE